MPKISVVIPIHNTRSFLSRCLDSVLAQSFSDWECILVNDGSTDDSAAICEAYCRRDGRFHLENQRNQGSAAARNRGMELARGEYLLFLDSDDAWPSYLLQTIVDAQQARPEDLVLWRFTSQQEELPREGSSFVPAARQQAGRLYLESCLYYVWNKLFHLDVIRQCRLAFPSGITYGEDVQFAMEYLCHWFRLHPGASFSISERPLYYYEGENEDSVTYRLKPCYCENEILLTGRVLDWFTRDFPAPEADFRHLLIHLLKTIAGGLAVDLEQPNGRKIARSHLAHPTVQRLIALTQEQGCYSPFLFFMSSGSAVAAGWLGRCMLRNSCMYQRVYWAGWHLCRLRTGRKPPVIL